MSSLMLVLCWLLSGVVADEVELVSEELLEELELIEAERDLGGGEEERDLGRGGVVGGSGVIWLLRSS